MTSRNRETLEHLFETGAIELKRSPLFDQAPTPLGPGYDFDRVEGMMLGLAVGYALGNTSEGLVPAKRQELYGEIKNYLPNRYAAGKPVGLPSDDTQLAFWTLEQIIKDGGFFPEKLIELFSQRKIFGIGSSVKTALRNYASGVRPWWTCPPPSAGNGALMRIAPMIIPHLKEGTAELWVDTALSALITHNDSSSLAACLSFVNMLWQLLGLDQPPEPEWWVTTYVSVAQGLELDKKYRPRGGRNQDCQGPVWKFVDRFLMEAYHEGLEAGRIWYSGAFLLETVPNVLFILMKYGHDPEEALVRAVNDTKDNDTTAAIVGAALGAWHGRKGLPPRWIEGLLGRTQENDDGRLFDLLSQARQVFSL